MPEYHDIKEAQIILEFTDSINTKTVKYFRTVQELAAYLKDHPKIAEAVKYIPK